MVEHPGPWPAAPITTEVLGDDLAWLVAEHRDHEIGVVLTRGTGGLWFADVAEQTLFRGRQGPERPHLEPTAETLTLVCTHGRRDACCAIKGRPLAEVAGRPASHIGGHRFAPTVLILPLGWVLGRLGPHEWPAVSSLGPAARPFCRGRVDLEPAAQVADLEFRQEHDLGLTESVRVDLLEVADDTHRFTCSSAVGSAVISVLRTTGASLPASCGAEPRPQARWSVVSVTRG